MLRAARMRVPQEKFPSDLAIGVREMVGTGGGGLSGNGITKALVDVSGPQARGEQAERRNQKTAVHTEKLIPICDSQLEGADVLVAAMRSITTRRSGEQFPREPVTRARTLPSTPYLLSSSKTVDPGNFAIFKAELFGMMVLFII